MRILGHGAGALDKLSQGVITPELLFGTLSGEPLAADPPPPSLGGEGGRLDCHILQGRALQMGVIMTSLIGFGAELPTAQDVLPPTNPAIQPVSKETKYPVIAIDNKGSGRSEGNTRADPTYQLPAIKNISYSFDTSERPDTPADGTPNTLDARPVATPLLEQTLPQAVVPKLSNQSPFMPIMPRLAQGEDMLAPSPNQTSVPPIPEPLAPKPSPKPPETTPPATPELNPTGSLIVGDPYTDSTNVPCATGTKDLGIFDGYRSRKKFPVRLCSLPNLPSTSKGDNPGSQYSIPGADGHGIVNSRVSEAWQQLVTDAKAAGIDLSTISSYRTYAQQKSLATPAKVAAGAVAPAGGSSHQAAVANDLATNGKIIGTFGRNSKDCSHRATAPDNPAWVWLAKNAGKYGFRQYSPEPWHWDAENMSNRCGTVAPQKQPVATSKQPVSPVQPQSPAATQPIIAEVPTETANNWDLISPVPVAYLSKPDFIPLVARIKAVTGASVPKNTPQPMSVLPTQAFVPVLPQMNASENAPFYSATDASQPAESSKQNPSQQPTANIISAEMHILTGSMLTSPPERTPGTQVLPPEQASTANNNPSSSANLMAVPSLHGVPADTIRAEIAFLIDKVGLTHLGAAYLTGNFIQESNIDVGTVGDSGKAKGLAQWWPGRRDGMPADREGQSAWAVNVEMVRDNDTELVRLLRDPNATEGQLRTYIKKWERYGIEGKRYEFGHILAVAIGAIRDSSNKIPPSTTAATPRVTVVPPVAAADAKPQTITNPSTLSNSDQSPTPSGPLPGLGLEIITPSSSTNTVKNTQKSSEQFIPYILRGTLQNVSFNTAPVTNGTSTPKKVVNDPNSHKLLIEAMNSK